MVIEQTLNDRALLDVVAMLSSTDESGRLQITAGSTRGAFIFRKGKLVDARIGPFTGFQAVNLAVLIGGAAHLSFDPSIEEPPTSSFKVHERLLLRERFGIETAPETACDPRIVNESAERTLAQPQQTPLAGAAFPESECAPAQKDEMESINIEDDFSIRAFSTGVVIPPLNQPVAPSETNAEPSRGKLAFLFSLPGVLINPSLTNNTRQKLAVRSGLILMIVIPATIGLASYWSKGKATAPLDVSPIQTSPVLPAPASVSSQNNEQNVRPKPTIALVPREAQPSTAKTAAPLKVNDATIVSDAPSPDNTEAVSDVTAERKALEEKSSVKPTSRTIAVVLQIEEGRVTEAYIRDHQAGLGAYEATALRLARQRRYPKDVKRKETVTMQVTVEP